MKRLDGEHFVVTDYRNGLMRVHIATGKVTPMLERRNTERFKGVNDLVFDSQGNLYFTDQGQTGLHDPSGRVFRLAWMASSTH
jgi:gluconolactonase